MAKLFRHQCRRYGARTAHREKDLGIWLSYSWSDIIEHAGWIALALVELGLKRGEVDLHPVGRQQGMDLLRHRRAICVGAITSGVYTTDSASQLKYLVNDSDSSKFLFVENDEQLDKFLEVRDRMPGLEKIIVLDREGLRGFADDKVMFLDELYRIGREGRLKANPDRFEEEIDLSRPDDIAHADLHLRHDRPAQGRDDQRTPTSCTRSTRCDQALPGRESDEQLCFLPLCHVLERLFSVDTQLAVGSTT